MTLVVWLIEFVEEIEFVKSLLLLWMGKAVGVGIGSYSVCVCVWCRVR